MKRIHFVLPVLFFAGILSLPVSSSLAADTQNQELLTLRGVSHIHTIYSHDSNATLDEVLNNMRTDGLDYAVITDHNSLKGIAKYRIMHAEGGPRLVFANEISAQDGHLIALGVHEMPPANLPSQELVDWIHSKGGYAILAHPLSSREPWSNWDVKNWDGFEVYNFGHELYDLDAIGFGIDLYGGDNEEVLKTAQMVTDKSFAFWDENLRDRRIAGVVGSNAHLKKNNKYFKIAVKSAILYTLVPDRSEKALVKALGEGRGYMVFETYGRAEGFTFTATDGSAHYNMGDEVKLTAGLTLTVTTPEETEIRLIGNGEVVAQEAGNRLSYTVQDAGAYRAEVYKGDNLWIFTNPIYIVNSEG